VVVLERKKKKKGGDKGGLGWLAWSRNKARERERASHSRRGGGQAVTLLSMSIACRGRREKKIRREGRRGTLCLASVVATGRKSMGHRLEEEKATKKESPGR
jgi:hypothetical protein